jgi:hypothetical protein
MIETTYLFIYLFFGLSIATAQHVLWLRNNVHDDEQVYPFTMTILLWPMSLVVWVILGFGLLCQKYIDVLNKRVD